jgi:hypothetical protein
MKKFAWLGFFFLSVLFASAQSAGDFRVVKTVNGNIVNFTVDNLGFIYLLSSDNQLKKIEPMEIQSAYSMT